ncbi:PolC-type DNA polymerase III [Gemmatimonas sp.]|uniref:PolC-type DNA polymerase III n=1 Tax=Gemmatimonas sp. TaxID=1962908 RepID=UPI0037C08636
MSAPLPRFGATVAPRPTTLSARAGHLLAAGPLDVVTLMCRVCQVQRLHPEAAERMALALLGGKPEFQRLPSGHWALSANGSAPGAGASPTAPRLADIAFAVVDVETTGTQAAGGDRITEIAIVQVRGGEVVEVFSRLVNPGRPIPPYITALTQISWAMVRDQPPFAEIAPLVMERLAGAVFVAHNAAFDWRFVGEELRRGAGHVLSGPRLCTVRLARKLLPDLPRRSLDHLTRYFGIEIEARHRAAGDALATAHALCRMLRVAEQEGYHTWHDLEHLLAPSSVRRAVSARDRRRRAFPLPATEDDIA